LFLATAAAVINASHARAVRGAVDPAEGVVSHELAPKQYRRPYGMTSNLIAAIDQSAELFCRPGDWEVRHGVVVANQRNNTSLEIPLEPPREYDFIVEFTRTSGAESVSQLLTRSGQDFEWIMGGWGNRFRGFNCIAGRDATGNPTGTVWPVENGRRYTSVVRVRDRDVAAYLDGKLVAEWVTTGDEDLRPFFRREHPAWLGLRVHQSEVVFHRVKLVAAALDPVVAWQVLPAACELPTPLRAAVRRRVAELDARVYNAREEATRALRELGPQGVPILLELDGAALSPEQQVRVAWLLAGHRRLTGEEAEALRGDREFLLDCMEADQAEIRKVADKRLRELVGHEIDYDPEASPAKRRRVTVKLRRDLVPEEGAAGQDIDNRGCGESDQPADHAAPFAAAPHSGQRSGVARRS
jgi:hypothetical protein